MPKSINHCTIAHKYYYGAKFAGRKYHELLTDFRSGISMTKHEFRQEDMVTFPLTPRNSPLTRSYRQGGGVWWPWRSESRHRTDKHLLLWLHAQRAERQRRKCSHHVQTILPKGTCFAFLTHQDVNLAVNHIINIFCCPFLIIQSWAFASSDNNFKFY